MPPGTCTAPLLSAVPARLPSRVAALSLSFRHLPAAGGQKPFFTPSPPEPPMATSRITGWFLIPAEIFTAAPPAAAPVPLARKVAAPSLNRSEEHTSELQSPVHLV